MTSSGTVSNHLWCSRYKDSIHLLTDFCSHCGTDNYLTVLGQQGLCRPLLLLCQWRKCAFQLSQFIWDTERWRARVYKRHRMTMIVCLHWENQYRNRKMLMCLIIWWYYMLETFVLEQIRTMAFLWQSLALGLICKCGTICKGEAGWDRGSVRERERQREKVE